jgi:hypothetical protein
MKRLNHKIIIILAAIALLAFMLWPSPERGPRQRGEVLMPWDLQHTSDGHTRVLGMVIGKSTLDDARKVLGSHGELALFQDEQGLSAESLFSEFTSGGLSGRIFLTLSVSPERLQQMAGRATKREPTEAGSIKLRPHWQDLKALGDSVIKAITYIPYVNLDDEVIRSRFGEPAQTVQVGEEQVHYLYPDKGLDLILDKDGKEVVQYVDPSDFSELTKPLKQQKQE